MSDSGKRPGFDLGWQDQEASQKRLQEISHHFLSDSGENGVRKENGRTAVGLVISKVNQLQDDVLHGLLRDSLGSLYPGATLLDSSLPLVSNIMLLKRADGAPGLVSFDARDSTAALLRGMEAEQKMRESWVLLCRLYPELAAMTPGQAITLTLVVPDAASAARMQGSPYLRLDCFSFTVLEVNGETGILLEQAAGTDSTVSTAQPVQGVTPAPQDVTPAAIVRKEPETGVEPHGAGAHPDAALSEEEENFFRQG